MQKIRCFSLFTIVTASIIGLFPIKVVQSIENKLEGQSPAIAQSSRSKFSDIGKNVYKPEIEAAANLGIVAGFPDGTFRPYQRVTREQAVSMITDALNAISPIDFNQKPTSRVRPFLDVKPDRWSYSKITWAQWNIAPEGTPTGNFRPEDYITRANLVAFLREAAEFLQIKLGGSSFLEGTQEPIKFTDVSGFNQQLALQMSAYCQVASPVNEKGTKFAPNKAATRDYTVAAIMRMLSCVKESQEKS